MPPPGDGLGAQRTLSSTLVAPDPSEDGMHSRDDPSYAATREW